MGAMEVMVVGCIEDVLILLSIGLSWTFCFLRWAPTLGVFSRGLNRVLLS